MVREDLIQVNEIDHEAFPTQWPPANYRQELQNRLARYIIVSDDSRTVDMLPIKPRPGLLKLASHLMPWLKHTDNVRPPLSQQYIAGFSGVWMMVDEAHITNLAVRKEYQSRGIGGLLLIATTDLAISLKASFLTLEVRASNLIAQKLYSRYGFRQTGLRRAYYLDNHEDAIIMSTEGLASPSFQANIQQLRESLSQKLSQISKAD
jgi:ribosomal-protein-alanine N-acetyltransferase